MITRLNNELGLTRFNPNNVSVVQETSTSVPHAWMPAKPKMTVALLDDFLGEIKASSEGAAPTATVGTTGTMTKFLARHAVDRLHAKMGVD